MKSTSSNKPVMTVGSALLKNLSGHIKYIETRHSVYRGVRRRGTLNRWVSEVRKPKSTSRIWLGTFPTAEIVARVHDVAVMALRGRSARLNFANSAWLINIPPSFSSVEEMKQVAVKVAEALHSSNSSYSANNVSVSTSCDEMAEGKEVASLLMPETTINSVTYDQMEFFWEGNGEINSGLYYAILAEALMVEPPIARFSNLDGDNELGVAVSLWN